MMTMLLRTMLLPLILMILTLGVSLASSGQLTRSTAAPTAPLDLPMLGAPRPLVTTDNTHQLARLTTLDFSADAHTPYSVTHSFSPDSRYLAVAHQSRRAERTLYWWDLTTGAHIGQANYETPPDSAWITFAPDNRAFVTAALLRDRGRVSLGITLWDVNSGARRSWRVARPDADYHRCNTFYAHDLFDSARFEPGSGLTVFGLCDGQRVIWYPRSGQVIREVPLRQFTPEYDGDAVLTRSTTAIDDLLIGTRLVHVPDPNVNAKHLRQAAINAPSGRYAYADTNRRYLVVRDLRTDTPLHRLMAVEGEYVHLSFNADGSLLAGLRYRGSRVRVDVWDMATGAHLTELDAPYGTSVSFSPDGSLLVGTTRLQFVYVWGIARGGS